MFAAARYLPLAGRQVSAVVRGRPVALAQLVHFGKQCLMTKKKRMWQSYTIGFEIKYPKTSLILKNEKI